MLHDIPAVGPDGVAMDLHRFEGAPLLVVNVASQCVLTPQYENLQQLQLQFGAAGFSVLGVPCNQFKEQEPGTNAEIAQFCSSTYGVSFPLLAKTDVNGPQRHPLFDALTQTADADGTAGDVMWNFEKFLVSARGEVVARFRPMVDPLDDAIVGAIRAELATAATA